MKNSYRYKHKIRGKEGNKMIHSVAVLGAGAVGSYVIWGISSLDDVELGVIAEGERAERIKMKGV